MQKNNLMAGISPIGVDWQDAVDAALVLPDGVYVPVGERPSSEMLEAMAQLTVQRSISERRIPADQSTEGVLLGEMMDYGISPITGKPVNSEHVNNCHILTGVGVARSGTTPIEQVGLYAHINPAAHVLQSRNFHKRLQERIRQLREATHQFTVDLLIAGGSIDVSSEARADWSTALCVNSIQKITELCAREFDVEPTVMRPRVEDLATHMSLVTQSRQLIVRPSIQPRVELPEEFAPSLFLASQAKHYIERIRGALEWR